MYVRSDLAYILPMGIFLGLVWIGTRGTATAAGNTWYPWAYVGRTVIVGAALVLFRGSYPRISWDFWWLGAIVGVAGVFQWVGMELFLRENFAFRQTADVAFNPEAYFENPTVRWSFVAVRLLGAAVVVPFMEELFWRDFCWRATIDFHDFQRVPVGEWNWKPFIVVPLIFSLVHGNMWMTSIVWAFLIGGLMAATRSLGACIIAHSVTNLLLGLYVLRTKQWFFW